MSTMSHMTAANALTVKHLCGSATLRLTCSIVTVVLLLGRHSNAHADRDRSDNVQACRDRLPSCDWAATLSALERSSLKRALAAKQLEIDNAPWNKTIDDTEVFVEPVFVEGGRYIRLLNTFHVESKDWVVAREMLIEPGEVWDQARIEESGRRLRDPLFSSVAFIVPVKRADSNKVGVLIVTRDIWSLRFNTLYRFQNSKFINLSFSLTEQNFLGRRKILSFDFDMNQSQIALGPSYIDRNLLGKRLRLSASVSSIYSRDALFDSRRFTSEGTQSDIQLSRPLWSLASKWGASMAFSHRFSIDRSFKGTSLRTFDVPETPDDDMLPWQYKQRKINTTAAVQRQFGIDIKHRFTLGHSFELQRPSVLPDFAGTDAQRASFIDGVLPRSEQNSVLFGTYNIFTPNFRTLHNIETLDLAEDYQMGPNVSTTLGVAPTWLGSSALFVRNKVDATWIWPVCHDGYIQTSAGNFLRLQHGRFIDNTLSGTLRVVAPSNSIGRIVARARVQTRWNDTQNQFNVIGSESGLRGFKLSEFTGQRMTSIQIEARSKALRWSALRFGGVAFYEIGGAADSFSWLRLHQDAGIGIRTLFPQSSREVFRFDLAFPFDGRLAGRPQFIAGFGSDF
jgi:hypothetical protein